MNYSITDFFCIQKMIKSWKRNSDRGALSCTAKWLVLYFSAESEVGTASASCFADTDTPTFQ